MISTAARKYRDLLEPAAAGEWTLPTPVIEAQSALSRVSKALTQIPEPPLAQESLNSAVTTALHADDPLAIDLTTMLDHPRRRAEYDALVSVLRTATERAEGDLSEAIHSTRDQIITGHLRPAGEKLWTEITKAVKELGDIDPADTDALLRAGDKARTAWLNLDGLAAKYSCIREAMSRLSQHTDSQPAHDVHGDHAEFEAGLCTLAGPNWRGMPTGPRPELPWPLDARGRLVYFVRHSARPWWPTMSERDAAWMAAHREAYERMQQQQQRHRVIHAVHAF